MRAAAALGGSSWVAVGGGEGVSGRKRQGGGRAHGAIRESKQVGGRREGEEESRARDAGAAPNGGRRRDQRTMNKDLSAPATTGRAPSSPMRFVLRNHSSTRIHSPAHFPFRADSAKPDCKKVARVQVQVSPAEGCNTLALDPHQNTHAPRQHTTMVQCSKPTLRMRANLACPGAAGDRQSAAGAAQGRRPPPGSRRRGRGGAAAASLFLVLFFAPDIPTARARLPRLNHGA